MKFNVQGNAQSEVSRKFFNQVLLLASHSICLFGMQFATNKMVELMEMLREESPESFESNQFDIGMDD